MTNFYRKVFYSIAILICVSLLIVAIVLGMLLKDKIPSLIVAFLDFYLINMSLALWISTSNVRMIHTKLAWLLSFLVFPIISIGIYLIWGRMPYYKKGILNYKAEYKKYLDFYDSPYKNVPNEDGFDLIAKYAYSTRKSDVFCETEIDVIESNNDFFKKSIELINSAKKTILINYYIVDNGLFYNSVKKVLINKAKQGVSIYFLFDRYGCTNKFTPAMVAELASHANIHVCKFESDRDVWTRSANNFRSHKKMLVIDNNIALYGGSNLADEYIGIKKDTPNWNDLNFVIKGPIIKSFLIDFCMDWDFSGFLPYKWKMGDYFNCKNSLKVFYWLRFCFISPWDKKNIYEAIKKRNKNYKLIDVLEKLNYFKHDNSIPYDKNNKAIFFQAGPRYYNNIVSDVVVTAILNAKKSVKIISPYLQLNESIMSALISTSHRHIKVDIITPGLCDDKWFLLEMNRSNYPPLFDAKVNLYEYMGFIHSKLIVIDDEYIITGTYNLDFRSLNSNFESIFVMKNEKLIKQVLEYWNNSIKESVIFSRYKFYETRSFKGVFVQAGLQIIQPLL